MRHFGNLFNENKDGIGGFIQNSDDIHDYFEAYFLVP